VLSEKRRKYCRFEAGELEIDYTNIPMLLGFVKESGGIVPARVTRTKAKYQRRVREAVLTARFLGLMKYSDAHR